MKREEIKNDISIKSRIDTTTLTDEQLKIIDFVIDYSFTFVIRRLDLDIVVASVGYFESTSRLDRGFLSYSTPYSTCYCLKRRCHSNQRTTRDR